MAEIVPPYISKMVDVYEKELYKAEIKELKAKKAYDYAVEYKNLCKVKLENAKKEEVK